MKARSYEGQVIADIIEVRFAYSGKIISVQKASGDRVKKGEIISSLDRKLFQMELDRQLADYERVRAEFEIFTIKNTDVDDISKYLRTQKQAALNAGVKDVEIAKYRLDNADMVSPVDGIIVDIGGLRPGIHSTPAGSAVRILDPSSVIFSFDIKQEDVFEYTKEREGQISIDGQNSTLPAKTKPVTAGKAGTFSVYAIPSSPETLIAGLKGKFTPSQD